MMHVIVVVVMFVGQLHLNDFFQVVSVTRIVPQYQLNLRVGNPGTTLFNGIFVIA
jgi:hypothetical protein